MCSSSYPKIGTVQEPLKRALNFMSLEVPVPPDEAWKKMPPAKKPRHAEAIAESLKDKEFRCVPTQSVTCHTTWFHT